MPEKFEVTYEELLQYANKEIRDKYSSISMFAVHHDVKKNLKDFRAEHIQSYLSVPKNGGVKVNRSFNFMKQLFLYLFNINIEETQNRIIERHIYTNKEIIKKN